MRWFGLGLFRIGVGATIALAYAGAAYALHLLLAAAWAGRPDPVATVAAVAGLTLLAGYASTRTATERALAALRAEEVTRDRAPPVHRQLDLLCDRTNVRRPRLYGADAGPPNALALGGSDGSAIVLGRELLRLLDPPEVACVLAHELAHLDGRDGLVQTLSFSLLGTAATAGFVALAPPLLLLRRVPRGLALARGRPAEWSRSPLARLRSLLELGVAAAFVVVPLVVLAHSRRHEYRADALAAAATGRPLTLARALRKIERATEPEAGLLAPLCVRGDEEGWLVGLLSTHPSVDARVERPRRLAAEPGPAT